MMNCNSVNDSQVNLYENNLRPIFYQIFRMSRRFIKRFFVYFNQSRNGNCLLQVKSSKKEIHSFLKTFWLLTSVFGVSRLAFSYQMINVYQSLYRCMKHWTLSSEFSMEYSRNIENNKNIKAIANIQRSTFNTRNAEVFIDLVLDIW